MLFVFYTNIVFVYMFSTLLNVDASTRTVFFLLKTYMISENPDHNSSQGQPRDSDVNEKLLRAYTHFGRLSISASLRPFWEGAVRGREKL